MLYFASALVSVLPLVCSALGELRKFNFTLHSATGSPDGFSRQVYLINGQQPGPLIDVDEGDILEVFVKNALPVNNTIHWHGLLQTGSPEMDGVPGVTQYQIPPGGNFTYRFEVGGQYGFYWYHSHSAAYYSDGIRGPLIIRPSSSQSRPFEKLASNSEELENILQAEKEAVPLMLSDWTHETSDVLLKQYMETGAFPFCADSILANGMGRVECIPQGVLDRGPNDVDLDLSQPTATTTADDNAVISETGMPLLDGLARGLGSILGRRAGFTRSGSGDDMHGPMTRMSERATDAPTSSIPTATSMAMNSMGSDMMGFDDEALDSRGCSPMVMLRDGYNKSSLAQHTCTNTTTQRFSISADATMGWLALNLVNSGSVSALRVSLDAHSMYVYAADGLYMQLQKVEVLEIAIGQRYSVMIRLDQQPMDYYLRIATFPNGDMQQVLENRAIVMYKTEEKDTKTDRMAQDKSIIQMRRNGLPTPGATVLNATALHPYDQNPPPQNADVTHIFSINQTDVVTWVADKGLYVEANVPIIYGNVSDGWDAVTTVRVPSNKTVDIVLQIANGSMDTGRALPYKSISEAPPSLVNLENPPYRDTANLPPGGWLAIRYITDNPGAWMLHCHLQWHMLTGLAVVLLEGEDELVEKFSSIKRSSGVAIHRPHNAISSILLCGMLALWLLIS